VSCTYPVPVDRGDVSGAQPAVGVDDRPAFALEIAEITQLPRTSIRRTAAPVVREISPSRTDDLQFDAVGLVAPA